MCELMMQGAGAFGLFVFPTLTNKGVIDEGVGGSNQLWNALVDHAPPHLKCVILDRSFHQNKGLSWFEKGGKLWLCVWSIKIPVVLPATVLSLCSLAGSGLFLPVPKCQGQRVLHFIRVCWGRSWRMASLRYFSQPLFWSTVQYFIHGVAFYWAGDHWLICFQNCQHWSAKKALLVSAKIFGQRSFPVLPEDDVGTFWMQASALSLNCGLPLALWCFTFFTDH